jgi:hypothetical protein
MVNEIKVSETVKKTEAVEMLKTLLAEGVCEIVFTGTDGSVKTVKATTKLEYLPSLVEGEITKQRKDNPNVIKFFDVTKNAWRSFNIDRMISFRN